MAQTNSISLQGTASERKLIFTSFEIRIFSVLVGLICAYLIKNVVAVDLPVQVFYLFYAWLFLIVPYCFLCRTNFCRTRRALENLHMSYYFIGVLFSTALMHYLGGTAWIAFFVYLFDLVYANVLMRRLKGAIVTAYIMACYFTLVFLEYKGIFPHVHIPGLEFTAYNDPRYIISTNIIVMGGIFFLMSYSTGLFAKMKEDREAGLIESLNLIESKSAQLEIVARSLKKQVAENKYLKSATMGYIEKKEFELVSARKEQEEQIDKLRKTQKSMFFMIEDLNEMSAQLKDARDHLEDKVRERTDELLDISQKLHRSERLAFLGKLAGSVTHELRNPLAVLKNAAYFLENRFKDSEDEKIGRYLEIIKKEINIIDSIIEDIMGFAKTKSPSLETVSVAEVVENAISAVNIPGLVEVRKEFPDIPEIPLDSNQLMHALMNIANNAIMAMNGNGKITFRLSEADGQVCIEVEDSGPGIPPDQRALIFEPLYSSKPKGTGLGLPIAKMMIENQDGRIEFDSELGKGTVFRIFLPVKRRA